MIPLKDLAIKSALENNWQEALILNQKILEEYPNDVDTLNRLAFAMIKLGKFEGAKEMYKKVVSIDKTNPIALKNLRRIEFMSKLKKSDALPSYADSANLIENLFIEEAGKTKTVELKNITDQKTLSFLQPGDQVTLVIKRSKIFVQAHGKKYIGMLPDHISARLLSFMKGGNAYSAFIKAINDKSVIIFIREIKRATRYKNQPSFSLQGISSYPKDDE